MSQLRTWYLKATADTHGTATLTLIIMASFSLSYFATQHFFSDLNRIGLGGYGAESRGMAAYDSALTEQYILEITNLVRSNRGLTPMDQDPLLWEVAQERSQDMVRRAYLSHYDPQTEECLAGLLLEEIGTSPVRFGEVILLTTPTQRETSALVQAAAVVQDWLDSPPHRDALLDPGYTQAGVGICWTEHGQLVATQILATSNTSRNTVGEER